MKANMKLIKFSFSLLLSSIRFHKVCCERPGDVQLCVKYNSTNEPVVNVSVSCYDEDSIFDDFLGSQYTGMDGCIFFEYIHDDDIFETDVDIYCEVSSSVGSLRNKTSVKQDWEDYSINFGTIFVEKRPTYIPTSNPTTEDEACILSELDLIDMFKDIKKIFFGLVFAFLLTSPALSVYCRRRCRANNTLPPIEKSYLISCIVKFIASFFSASVLVGGFIELVDKDCEENTITGNSISFIGAMLCEVVEFLFDFGRLVIFFGDPGKLDFYQNARWNSKVTEGSRLKCLGVGFSSLPVAILMFLMWATVSISHFTGGLFDENDGDNYFMKYVQDRDDDTKLWIALAIYGTLFFSCTGGYYLLRMGFRSFYCCGSSIENYGEEKGLGFFWGRFKLMAVDLPSIISTGLISPSTLVFFWTAEFINDMFPFIAGFFIEKCLLKETEEKDIEIKGEEDEVENKKDSKGKKNNHKSEVIIIPFKYVYTGKKLTSVEVDSSIISPDLKSQEKIVESIWSELCDRTNFILKSVVDLKSPRTDKYAKIVFIILGALLTILYWLGIYFNLASYVEEFGRESFIISFLICFSIGIFLSTKVCFGRHLNEENEILQNLDKVCVDFSRGGVAYVMFNQGMNDNQVDFSLELKEESFRKWLCRGSLSCAPGIDSVIGIKCLIRPTNQYSTSTEVEIQV